MDMWQCAKCREQVEENFETCWNCGTSREGVEDPAFQREPSEDVSADPKSVAVGRGAPTSNQGSGPALTPDALSSHLLARGLVWILRGLAVLAAIWGLINLVHAMEASRAVRETSKHLRDFTDDSARLTQAAEKAGTIAVLTALVSATALVAVLLALAEGLRLCILIEGNTRGRGKVQAREREKRRPK
jgi:hypothetical protein